MESINGDADNKKKIKESFYSHQFFYTYKCFYVFRFSRFQGLIYKIKFQNIFILRNNLTQTIKKIKNKNYSNQFFYTPRFLYIFRIIYFSRTNLSKQKFKKLLFCGVT